MNRPKLDPAMRQAVRKAQVDEETGALLYGYLATRQKDEQNRKLFEQMAADEKKSTRRFGRAYPAKSWKPSRWRLMILKLLSILLGFTFVVKRMQKDERLGQARYEQMKQTLPQAARMLEDERAHEKELYGMLDEERLHYVGSMVLGLNDALVELTGAIAGVTFALANTRLVAMTGIITGISATLSMAASNYLAERADGNSTAFKSSLYTGAAYLITVALLVLPYLLFPTGMYVAAFAVMITTVLLIILFFNYYLSVAKEEPFLRHFLEMALISLSVAVISFVIGIVAKNVLGIDAL
ncbi:VIT1/CCC1 transporter family protein [Agathobaculum sp. NTUH-O15-33]|uniref:VIT1/CCC1 transporter family protein n=1 Tax=Agathobaculum sp. NTUH-O15-33 TaxID=3079302 RepID=UPI0029586BAE|nr:VIT1/CCC1 transporter family protein [Agathobaculum sp. NTUH-O15-33]WNX86066.1 VIT1/CCC1 transporter family protein [Agathobaculum sp. NTUH-O15-33]